MQRTRIRDVELTGTRMCVRWGGFALLVLLAAVGFLGYLLPSHRMADGSLHSNFDDGGVFSLVVFLAFGVITALLSKRGLGAGILAGVLAVPAAIASVAPIVLTHLFQEVRTDYGEGVFAVGVIGLFCAGVVFAIVEPILYVLQRRANERAAKPSLPVARVYA